MLKACLDCIAGDQRQSEDPYSVRLNGGSRAPPWPIPEPNMAKYLIPTQLQENSSVVIEGEITGERLYIMLGGDNGPTFTLDANFSSDLIYFNPSVEGDDSTYNTSDHFTGSNYTIEFQMLNGGVIIFVQSSKLNSIPLQEGWLRDFRYLSINGNVSQLTFKFQS